MNQLRSLGLRNSLCSGTQLLQLCHQLWEEQLGGKELPTKPAGCASFALECRSKVLPLCSEALLSWGHLGFSFSYWI